MLPNPSRKDTRERSKTCICKCRSHCMLLNPSTGVYEGLGKPQSRSAWDNHARDDKRLLAREQLSASNQSSHIPMLDNAGISSAISHIPPAAEPQTNLIRLVEQEVLWYNDLPVTTPTVPLLFVNDPMSCGEYQWGERLIPNSGLHALRTSCYANSAFLTTEHRFCELITVLQSIQQDDETIALGMRLCDGLAHLNHEKELQWVQQRGRDDSGKILVNTGA
jgi:hypothetical protein